jgi:putative NADH-flavin reductase
MHERGVRRLVVVSASGWIVDGDDPLSRFLLKPVLDRFLGDTNADLAATERLVRASGLDWTIVRPPRPTGRPGRGRYRARRDGNVRWGSFLSRADLALALVDGIEDAGAAGRTVSVAG